MPPAPLPAVEAPGERFVGGVYAGRPFGEATAADAAAAISQLPGPLAPQLVAIAAGMGHYCALLLNGTALCAGEEQDILGDDLGLRGSSLQLAPVSGGLRFTVLAAGSDFTCGVLRNGTLFCWASFSAWGAGWVGGRKGARLRSAHRAAAA